MHPRGLSIADFTYALPEERIAQQPLADRDASKLLVWRDGRITDRVFSGIADELPSGSLLVLNDTRVVNARLVFHRSTGGRIEVLCLSPVDGAPVELAFEARDGSTWHCFIGNAKRWREGEELLLRADGLVLRAVRTGIEQVRFAWEPRALSFSQVLDALGHVPLPPYMKRADAPADKERYNTVFAEHQGSVAAPTASLHFTPALLDQLARKDVERARLTLHVGAGTFLPVKSERMDGHSMHQEEVRIARDALRAIVDQAGAGPIVAVGTTAMRTLESLYWHGVRLIHGEQAASMDVGQWEPYDRAGAEPSATDALQAVIADLDARGESLLSGRTRLLIAPGYRFRIAEGLITNFHQPQSTLLLLVAAFVGPDWRRIYGHALANGYRFLSYGDASLLWRSGA
ncbi:MAG: S-adenosylmethionine:tRNA ribosyltransferase-isomerase [Flavobacteriales bacterium]|jgi:S-adenosylmethionine:tRNA ribosyltransferase-isomerase|nr:S-adenosylmethionine:tRNA ribosyltransferase-isomerase [Flavobacteriales bacterium]